MTRLSDLHRRLIRLKHRRQLFRWVTAYSALATAVILALVLAFPLDWYFQQSMDFWQRLFLLVICSGVAVWAFARYTVPWLGHRESELDLALLVERHEQIDTDLVAALEFEWPDAPTWGSVQLEEAVITRVAERGRQLRVMENLPKSELRRRVQALLAVAVVAAGVTLIFPDYVLVFLNRILLGSQHYPTKTQIEKVVIKYRSGTQEIVRELPMDQWGGTKIRVRYGQAVNFEIYGKGELPDSGNANLVAQPSGSRVSVVLERAGKESEVYKGLLPRLVGTVRCQFYLGDAWTEPGDLAAAQLPVVELEPEVVLPVYAAKNGKTVETVPRGMRQFSVLEGSQVRMKVRSDKRLEQATIKLDDKEYRLVRDESASDQMDVWRLGDEETPLSCVADQVRFSVQVSDEEQQQLERAIEGTIRVQADRPPRVAAVTRTPYVVPTGMPTIYYRAIDDHAIGRLWLACEVVRAGQKESEGNGEAKAAEVKVYDLAEGQSPQRNIEGQQEFRLAPLKVAKGDTVKVTVWAKSYRGKREGKAAAAEPLVFQVTDQQGILASMLESDKQSARELKIMIQRQLGIGDTP